MWKSSNIKIINDDITTQKVDIIINAANVSLFGGGGVDGAIHKAAGPELQEECKFFNGCPIGEARITRAYNLPSKYIIHTPGPIWRGGFFDEKKLLQNSYTNSLKKAIEVNAKSIAFPSISTGGHNFPPEIASEIALTTIYKVLNDEENEIKNVFIVCISEKTMKHYQKTYEKLFKISSTI